MELSERELKLAEELAGVIADEDALDKKPKKEITDLVSNVMFGPGVANKRVNIRWGMLFGKNACPVGEDTLVKTKDAYVCGKCGLKIPSELYEKAREQHAKEAELAGREEKVNAEMEENGMPHEKVDAIYELAIDRAENKGGRGGA
jgi:hypothetical protein